MHTLYTYLLGDAIGIMRCQCHFHSIVHVQPFGMMIHFFCQQRRSAHKRPRLVEVRERKCFHDCFILVCLNQNRDKQ